MVRLQSPNWRFVILLSMHLYYVPWKFTHIIPREYYYEILLKFEKILDFSHL
jgi:hypothetical protein